MSTRRTIEFGVGASRLMLVPAVHFRVPFAEAVNEICCAAGSRPDAVAVELGPAMARAASEWLGELGVGPARRRRLPCMLGLVHRLRSLRASVRERAHRLQLASGLELDELPPEVLDRELGYCAHALVMLTPTDSIIEALRCARELGVPAYGVDLDEHPRCAGGPVLIPDPALAAGRVAEFVRENDLLARQDPDPEVNHRRELAMAARLKGVLANHRRVLFTCGLAHWRRVADRVRDPALRPAPPGDARRPGERLRRVRVDPRIAARAIDRLPAAARWYERRRRHPGLDANRPASPPLPLGAIFEARARRAARAYLRAGERGQPAPSVRSAQALREFPGRLATHARLALRAIPELDPACACARAFVDSRFADCLAEALTGFPWVRAEEFPDLPLLAPEGAGGGACRAVLVGDAGERSRLTLWIPGLDGEPESAAGPDRAGGGDRDTRGEHREGSPGGFTWEAWDDLVTALCEEAIERASPPAAGRGARPFRGALLRGPAFKATLRARARGEDRLYVYDGAPRDSAEEPPTDRGWPVVWLFDTGPARADRWHNYLMHLGWLRAHAADPEAFERRFARHATRLSALIGFGGRERGGAAGGISGGLPCTHLRGVVVFGPVFTLDRQFTRWLELTRGARNPLYRYTDERDLPDALLARCAGLDPPLGSLAWQDDLVRMGLAYAGPRLTLVAPRALRLAPQVRGAAEARGQRLARVALEAFRHGEVERLQCNLSVPGVGGTAIGRPLYERRASARLETMRAGFPNRFSARWREFGR